MPAPMSLQTLQEWAKHLLDYAELLFPAESIEAAAQQAEKQQINEIFLLLSEEFSAVHNQPIPLAVILAWLEGRAVRKAGFPGIDNDHQRAWIGRPVESLCLINQTSGGGLYAGIHPHSSPIRQ
jgi:hypothetical protein